MYSNKDHNHRYIFISVFSTLFPSHCLLSHLVFHWRGGTGSLDADIEIQWESIEAFKSNFTTRPAAWKASPLRKVSWLLVQVFMCVRNLCGCGKPNRFGMTKRNQADFFVLFTFSLPLLSDLHCSSFLTSLSVPSRTLISCPSGLPPKISVCPLSFHSSGHQRDNHGICRASALW